MKTVAAIALVLLATAACTERANGPASVGDAVGSDGTGTDGQGADASDVEAGGAADAARPDAEIDAGIDADAAPDAPPLPFERFTSVASAEAHIHDRLCVGWDAPESLDDKVFIDCRIEGGGFSPDVSPPAPASLVVFTYNMERGVHLDEQIALFASGEIPVPDILLINEIDRGCSRSGRRNGMREFAEALGLNYVFATEFVELPRGAGSGGTVEGTCEHGNAVASRFPIGNVRAVRHAENKSWYLPPDERESGEPRLGGRVAVIADVLVGDEQIRVYSIHYESHPIDGDIRDAQAIETAEWGREAEASGRRVIVGGDTNAPLYWLDLQQGTSADPTVNAFIERGYVDAHAPLAYEERKTRGAFVLDLLFGSDDFWREPQVCPEAVCGGLSDHLPVWAVMDL